MKLCGCKEECFERLYMKCPCCDGEGGEFDAILFYGIGGGINYDCNYCKGYGEVSIYKWIKWHWWFKIKYPIQDKFFKLRDFI